MYEEVQIFIASMKHELKQLIKRVHVKKNMIIFFVPTNKLHFLLDNMKYINIKGNIFKSMCNLAAEFHNDTGKLLILNCPCEKPALIEGFIVKHCKINIIRLNQIRKLDISSKGKKIYSYLIWIKGKRNIRKLLLSVIDFVNDKNRIGSAIWPKSKGEEIKSINSLITDQDR